MIMGPDQSHLGTSRQPYDVETMSYERRCDVSTLVRRCLRLCASAQWLGVLIFRVILGLGKCTMCFKMTKVGLSKDL